MERVRELVETNKLPAPSSRFGPHATLLGGLAGTSAFASNTIDGIWTQVLMALGDWKNAYPDVPSKAGFDVAIAQPDTRGTYFQSVVLALDKPQVLTDLHACTRRLLAPGVPGFPEPELTTTAQYWPHVSLVYADLDEDKAKQVLALLNAEGIWHDGAVYPHPTASLTDKFDHVTFSSLALWSCQGPPSEWTKLHEVQFADL